MSDHESPGPLNAMDVYLVGTWIDSADRWEVRADAEEQLGQMEKMRKSARNAAQSIMVGVQFLPMELRESAYRRAGRLYQRGRSIHYRAVIAHADKLASELPSVAEEK